MESMLELNQASIRKHVIRTTISVEKSSSSKNCKTKTESAHLRNPLHPFLAPDGADEVTDLELTLRVHLKRLATPWGGARYMELSAASPLVKCASDAKYLSTYSSTSSSVSWFGAEMRRSKLSSVLKGYVRAENCGWVASQHDAVGKTEWQTLY